MKRIIICIIVLTIQLINAQNRDLKRANLYFERTFYNRAIPLYEKNETTKLSFETVSRLADSYYYTQDMENALKWYQLLIRNFEPNLHEGHYHRYAQTLKALNKYDEGNAVLRKQLEQGNSISTVNKFDEEVQLLENIIAIGNRFELKNLEINTKNSDFGAVKNGDNLVFTTTKKSRHWFSKIYKWNDETYLDLYTVPIDMLESENPDIKNFSKKINTRLHESNAIFTKDGKTIYFTRNSRKHIRNEKTKMKISHLQIYKAEFIDGEWKNIQLLPFNIEGYSTEHPALSNDEKTLYFSSDRPGTIGSFDIFSVTINNDGTFKEPKNLGDKVNTKGNDQFPFISKDNKLYFSSDGHLGLGGLDVFVCDIENKLFPLRSNIGIPVNIGSPVNSGYDDFAFTIDADTKTGYFASNRPGGKGSDDIYAIKETKPLVPEECQQSIAGIVTDINTGLFLKNVLVVLQDDQKNEIERIQTDHEGKFNLLVACNKEYTLFVSKKGYTSYSKGLQTDKERKKINYLSFALKSHAQIKKEKQIETELAEKKRLEQKALLLQQKLDAKAKMEADLVLKKEQEILARKEKEKTAKKEKEEAERKKKEQLEQLVNNDKNIIKEKDKYFIKTEPIYFDYDLYYIRRDSKIVLDKVVGVMNKYPDMIIQVNSHTDTRGTNIYNIDLSKKRAVEIKNYLLRKGIEPKRIQVKGYGKTMPIIPCEPPESCTEEQHELNRRSEFVIKNL